MFFTFPNLESIHPWQLLSLVLVVLILIILSLRPYYLLATQKFYYPSLYPFFGHQIQLLNRGFQVCHTEWIKSMAARNPAAIQIFAQFDGLNVTTVVADPRVLTKVLITDFSTFPDRKLMILHQKCVAKSVIAQPYLEWRVGRKVLVGTFTTSMLKTMIKRNVGCTLELLQGIKSSRKPNDLRNVKGKFRFGYPLEMDGSPFEAKTLFGTFAIDIITRNALGFKLEMGSTEFGAFIDSAQEIFTYEMLRLAVMSWFKPLTELATNLFGISFVGEASLIYIRDVICQMASMRQQSSDYRKDLYQMMMDAAQKHTRISNPPKPPNLNKCCPFGNRPAFGEENVDANAIFIVLAAYDTLSTALSWVIYHLASKPELQERVHGEIVRELGSDPGSFLQHGIGSRHDSPEGERSEEDGSGDSGVDEELTEDWLEVDYEALKRLVYTEMFIKEVLRVDPPLAIVNRVAAEDWEMEVEPVSPDTGGGQRVAFKKGSVIDIPIYAIHHNPRYWTDPEKFDPDRFAPNRTIHKCTYLPFGVGPRNCAAEKYALLTMKAFLAVALQKVKFVKCASTRDSYLPSEVSFKKNEFHYPSGGIWVAARKRC